MKVALVHDWLTGMRGGERCLESFLAIYPDADIYTLFHRPGSTSALIDSRVVGVSFLNKLPGATRYYRALLPLFPLAIRQLKLRQDYDLVVSLSHAAAKNISVPSGTKHICYCFTPMRYIWDQAESYFGRITPLLRPLIHYLRRWDKRGNKGVDRFVAISSFVAARIRRFYGRDADVVFPPVATSWIATAKSANTEAAFLYAGALVPYKRIELILEAFVQSGLPLVVAGAGPLEKVLKAKSTPNIKFLGRVSDLELSSLYASSRALVFAAREDFGMIPVESLAAGTPVISAYDGALKESMASISPWLRGPIDFSGSTGVFFKSPRRKSSDNQLLEALRFFLQHEEKFRSEVCVAHARKFSFERFRSEWELIVDDLFRDSSAVRPRLSVGKYAQAEASAF